MAAPEKTSARLMDKKGGCVYIYSVASFFTCERTWLCIFSAPTRHIWRRTLHKNIGS